MSASRGGVRRRCWPEVRSKSGSQPNTWEGAGDRPCASTRDLMEFQANAISLRGVSQQLVEDAGVAETGEVTLRTGRAVRVSSCVWVDGLLEHRGSGDDGRVSDKSPARCPDGGRLCCLWRQRKPGTSLWLLAY